MKIIITETKTETEHAKKLLKKIADKGNEPQWPALEKALVQGRCYSCGQQAWLAHEGGYAHGECSRCMALSLRSKEREAGLEDYESAVKDEDLAVPEEEVPDFPPYD